MVPEGSEFEGESNSQREMKRLPRFDFQLITFESAVKLPNEHFGDRRIGLSRRFCEVAGYNQRVRTDHTGMHTTDTVDSSFPQSR